MKMMLADMLGNGRCVGSTSKPAVETLLLDPCELLLPHKLARVRLGASKSLVLAIMNSRKEPSRYPNRLRHLYFSCLL